MTPVHSVQTLAAPPRLAGRHWVMLAGACLAGFGLRVVALPHPPPGLWFDEALNGFNALDVLAGRGSLYFARHGYPEEPLHMVAMALVMKFAGVGELSIRLTSAIAGTLTLPFAFLCFREVFRSNQWALLGTVFLAAMRWHVHFSRVGLRTVWVPAFACAIAWLALRALRRPDRRGAMALGLCTAAAMYTYLTARLIPLVLFALLVWDAMHRPWRRGLGVAIAVAVLALGAGVAPLVIHLARNPDLLRGRVAEISLFGGAPPADDGAPPAALGQGRRVLNGVGENLVANLAMFHTWGDHVPKHDIPRVPVFDPVTSALMLAGLVTALGQWSRTPGPPLLVLWLGTLLLASVLSFGAPNMLRTAGAAPAALGLVVLGLRRSTALVRHRWGGRAAFALFVAWGCWFILVEVTRYWEWGGRSDVWADFSGREHAVARSILDDTRPGDRVFAFEGWFGHDAFALLTRDRAGVEPIATGPPVPALGVPEADQPLHVYLLMDLAPQRALRGALIASPPSPRWREEPLRGPDGRPFATHLIFEAP